MRSACAFWILKSPGVFITLAFLEILGKCIGSGWILHTIYRELKLFSMMTRKIVHFLKTYRKKIDQNPQLEMIFLFYFSTSEKFIKKKNKKKPVLLKSEYAFFKIYKRFSSVTCLITGTKQYFRSLRFLYDVIFTITF